ncbi:MAG: signal recognition particle protein, partial [Thermogutta sp.]|nr:signal recognition particle protein [Thermogutta sp.]
MVQQLSRQMMSSPEALLSRQKKGTGKRLGSAEKAALRKQRERELRRRKREKKKK